jgi:serine/threonine-protein kinase
MVYAPGNWTTAQLVLVDRQGRSHALRQDPQPYSHPRYSPDGKRLAVAIGAATHNSDIWVEDLASGTLTRFTHDGRSSQPEWTADGRRIAWWFDDGKGGEIRWQSSDGSGAAEPLASSGRTAIMAPSGGFFVTQTDFGGNVDMISLDSARRRRPLVRAPRSNAGSSVRISPDGRWLAYVSSESGRSEVYVRPIGGGGGLRQISTQGGTEPVWSPTGRELFYRVSGQFVVATLATVPEVAFVRRDTLFADRYLNTNTVAPDYDVSRDGKSFGRPS